jgi:hypothetical protein
MEKVTVNISDIILDKENFRLGQLEDQRDIIMKMTEDQKLKLVNLILDIAENGLNPLENIAVIPVSNNDGTYCVVEGNRRVLALKILVNPDILNGTTLENQKSKIINEIKKYDMPKITELECIYFDCQDDAVQWMQLKHTGENDGRGTVPWSATAKTRMAKRYGEKGHNSNAIEIIDFVSKFGHNITNNYPITNLTRLLSSPEIRERLGIADINPVVAICPRQYFVNLMLKIIEDMNKPSAVNKIYYKSNRLNYIEDLELRPFERIPQWVVKDYVPTKMDIKSELTKQSTDISSKIPSCEYTELHMEEPETHINFFEDKPLSTPVEQRLKLRTMTLPSSAKRNRLIPSSFSIHIKHPKTNQIFRELKRLDLNEFPNAAAILLRVFIELSLDEYIYNKKIETDTKILEDLKLYKKLQRIRDFMSKNHILTDKQLHPVDIMISDPASFMSTATLNAYVHSPNTIPLSKDLLNNTWDNIQLFIEKLWS